MRTKLTIGAVATALVLATGVLVGTSLAGGDEDQSVGETEMAKPIVVGKASEVAAKAKRRTPTVQFFFARNATVPEQGSSLVQPLKCPRGAGQPIAGGIRPSEGLVVSYLSRINPQTEKLPKGVYYVGVRNQSAPAGTGAIAEIQCARNMKVIAR